MTKHVPLFITYVYFCNMLYAQDPLPFDTVRQMDEITITYQADKLTPVTFQNLFSKEIEIKSTGQEPSFLLAETPSITSYSDAGNPQGYSYFRIRGIDQTRINMTLDGVPLNEPEDQGAYFSNYPDILNSVSKIQIQRGVGTSKNGVAAYGGSVQLFSPNLKGPTKTDFGLGYGSFNSLRAFAEHNSGVKNNKAFYVRASEIYSDGYKYHSSNHSQSVFLSSGVFHDKTTWKLNFLAGRQQNGMAWLGVSDSLIRRDPRTNANSEQEKDRFFQCLTQLQNLWQTGPSSFLQTSVYHTYLKGNYGFDLNNFLGAPSTNELYDYAFNSNFLGAFSNYNVTIKGLNLTAGVQGNIYNRQHTGSEKAIGELYQNTGHKNEAGLFSGAEYTLGRFTLFTDIQMRYVEFDYDGLVPMQGINWTFINPKAGASLTVMSDATLYYSLGRTGREPTRNDMFGGNDDLLADSLGRAVLFNTDPEYVLDHELGYRYRKDRLELNLGLYYMDFKNEIVLDGKFGPNGLALTNNVEQSIRTGIEIYLAYKPGKRLSFIHNSSFNYSRIKEQTEEFSPILTPPVIINQEAVYSYNDFSISLSARYQHHSYIDFANSETVKGYFLLNSRTGYQLKRYQFSLFLNNITNTRYFNHAYIDYDGSKKSFVQAPIHVYAAIQYSL